MTLDQLKTFQMVAAEKSFGRAAELLHLTQPAISKQIRALETELDQRLFERGRKVQITAAGMTLLRHVEQLGHILRAAHDEMADLRELRGGYLRIGAAHSIATYVLPSLIEAYRSRHPKVNLASNRPGPRSLPPGSSNTIWTLRCWSRSHRARTARVLSKRCRSPRRSWSSWYRPTLRSPRKKT